MDVDIHIPTWLIIFVAAIGTLQLLKVAKVILSAIGFLLYSSGNLKKFGEWVIVTGSTDGIGLGYARQFAKRGLNLVLISRSEEKLKKNCRRLESCLPQHSNQDYCC